MQPPSGGCVLKQGDNLQMLGSSQGAQAPSAAAQKPTPAQPSQPVEFDDNIPF